MPWDTDGQIGVRVVVEVSHRERLAEVLDDVENADRAFGIALVNQVVAECGKTLRGSEEYVHCSCRARKLAHRGDDEIVEPVEIEVAGGEGGSEEGAGHGVPLDAGGVLGPDL
jgi:uncharacterized protein (UPF0297 family)